MTGDEMEFEAQIAGILDRLSSEMKQAAARLRVSSPYETVEEFIGRAQEVLRNVVLAGNMAKQGDVATAIALCPLIEVPEIELDDNQAEAASGD